jgi:hypothetical protein
VIRSSRTKVAHHRCIDGAEPDTFAVLGTVNEHPIRRRFSVMRRIAIAVGIVILVVGLIGAGMALASKRTRILQHQALSFALQLVNEDTGDIRPAGDSTGDTFFAQGELQDFDLTKRLGGYASACVLENVDTRLNHCTATASLAGGNVELSGRFRFTDPLHGFRLAVVGGTGIYQNVVGQATVTFGCDACPPDAHDVDTLTLVLTPSFQQP